MQYETTLEINGIEARVVMEFSYSSGTIGSIRHGIAPEPAGFDELCCELILETSEACDRDELLDAINHKINNDDAFRMELERECSEWVGLMDCDA